MADSFEPDYKQLSRSLTETQRRAYDEGLMMSVLERMSDLEADLREMRELIDIRDNYNKKKINAIVNSLKVFGKRLKVAVPSILNQVRPARVKNDRLVIINDDNDEEGEI